MLVLPRPNAGFDWIDESWGRALRCGPLARVAQHGFTTRELALRGGPSTEPEGWRAAAALAGVGPERLARVKQVHGREVRVLARGGVDGNLAHTPEADAIVGGEPGTALAVVVADCVPVLLADARAGVAAAVHAGWRGTAAGVVRAAIARMRDLGARPEHIVAAIGPSIGPCCYEVGDELVDAFLAAGHARADVERWFHRAPHPERAEGALRLDVARANADQLEASGVSADRIHACGLCTKTHCAIFDSYRADGPEAGRMAAVIAVPPARG